MRRARTAQTGFFGALSCLLLLSAVACSGTLGDPYGVDEGSAGTGSGVDPTTLQVAPHSRFPRLSHTQWERTVVDLFHLDAPTGLSASFTPDPLGGKAFDNNESSLQVTPGLWADYQRAAEEIALQVTSNQNLLDRILPANLPQDLAAKKTAFLQSFGRRAFRRPLSPGEVDQYAALFDQAPTLDPVADPFTGGVRLVIEAFLQSPSFVYRPELSVIPRIDGLIPLNSWEVATRLSYALWGTMPDDTLLDAAESGKLGTAGGVEAEAHRLLNDDRARDSLVSFHDQLYDAEQYASIDKSIDAYPSFDPAIGDDMRKELSLFVDYVLFTKKGGLSDLLTSRTTFVNARLAQLYGLDASGMDNTSFVQVDLPEAERSGLLTRSGFLAWKGTKSQPDTILRGVFINRRILCQPLGDPPAAAMGAMLGPEKTDRERVWTLTGDGTCGQSCHGTYIDPAGFAFENYGALGEYRTQDNGYPVDASDTFPFQDGARSYKNAVEFSAAAAEAEQTHECYARFWVEYLYGRDVQDKDAGLLKQIASLSKKGSNVEDIVVALVTSDAFLTRAPQEVP